MIELKNKNKEKEETKYLDENIIFIIVVLAQFEFGVL
jgi:hypothetical protein